ncbi:Exodeoxyribonuclease V alpha chain [Luteitalea pratensis]|uniref:Exodeoxyribonuclease V alpha chain n=1 Tax=Luteitalea pratensis TaxID=1855912 RepID=A0A143PUI1_LUTPR|nr:ATP-dependent RecD-like DNA helicase [Luteitalea pratensis]AMY11469.1 Exodeoxyribonuclease V alpha chain [Luteitalea pratensis]
MSPRREIQAGRSPLLAGSHQGAEYVAGQVERITYHDAESGFCVLRVALRSRREPATVVGHAAQVAIGEHVHATGAWVQDRTHGQQFKADWIRVSPPDSPEGIERYLGSGLIKGVGPHLAKLLVAAFGTAVFDVIDREPDRLLEIAGIGHVRARRIVENWQGQRAVREIMVFLHTHGVSTSRAVRIHRTYGADAVKVLTEDPYRLARDIRGVGFLTADQIARQIGVPTDAMSRRRGALQHVLSEAVDQGHCALPVTELRERTASLVELAPSLIDEAIAEEIAAATVVGAVIDGTPILALATLDASERTVATRLAELVARPRPWPDIDADRAIPWAEGKLSLALSPSQRVAVARALGARVLVLTGGPGVGKTTVLRAILAILMAKGVRPLLAAPTGRAAKRMTEATGLEAKTIHRLLEINPQDGRFRRRAGNPLEGDLLVVDESSMVDVVLMAHLLQAVPDTMGVLLVGDVDQLPSVGPGQVLADVIDSGRVPVARLTEIHRQSAESRIVLAAHAINAGDMPAFSQSGQGDCFFVEAEDAERALQRLLQVVSERIPQRFGLDPVRDVQVLCPMNRGGLGAQALNQALQRLLNPHGAPAIERYGQRFAVGDKVMQIENDYDKEVYNGDLGVVRAIAVEEETMTVEFDGRPVTFDFGDLDRVVLAYATTVHKAQGSEYPAVVIPVTTQHYPMLQRHLLYTGVTRGKRLVVLVGQTRALAIAVRGKQTRRRWSQLRALLSA